MYSNDSPLVAVHASSDWRAWAEVPLSALRNPHRPRFGDCSDAVLHAYVAPADIVCGDRLGRLDADPHTAVLVCVRRKFNTRAIYAHLIELAERGSIASRTSE
jgi:hypothetical protein